MNIDSLSRDLWLLTNFYNGWEMVIYLRKPRPISQAKLFNGKTIIHPADKRGLVDCILELWFTNSYFPDNFYFPKANDVIVDIGANIGLFTLQSARKNPHCKIASFEPLSENFYCLSQNISNFKLENVTAYQYAIGSSYREDFIVSASDRSLDNRLLNNSEENSSESNHERVNTIPFESIFDLIKSQDIALLKMDIEGGEKEVFESTSPEILKRVNCLAIEYHDNIYPGILDLIKEKLESTHHLNIVPSRLDGCGLLFAVRD